MKDLINDRAAWDAFLDTAAEATANLHVENPDAGGVIGRVLMRRHPLTDDEVASMRYDTRYVDGRFEYGRWHRDVADRPVWTPYQPPQVTADGAQEPG